MQQIFEILLWYILFIIIFISYSVYRIIIMHEALSLFTKKSKLHKTSLIFTKTPLKFSSISLIAEKKYGNYASFIIEIS